MDGDSGRTSIPLQSLSKRRHDSIATNLSMERKTGRQSLLMNIVQVVPVDWTSPHDPANPQNWNSSRKIFHTIVPAISTFVVVLATSVYVPAIPYVQQAFDTTNIQAVLGLSLYLIGVTIGSTLGGPISELGGRQMIYLMSLPILMGLSVGAAMAQSLAVLLVCRLVAGLGGSLCISVGGGTITDIWDMKSTTGVLASLVYILMPFLAPTIGPLTGAYITHDKDNWRWCLWIIVILAGPIYLASVFMKETFKEKILRDRKASLGLGIQLPRRIRASELIWIAVTRTLSMLMFEPLVTSLAVYTSFGFAIIFIFFDIFPTVFSITYGFTDKQTGLTFLSLFVGYLIAVVNFAVFAGMVKKRDLPMEYHMHCALLGSLILPGSLFWLAFTCNPNFHWIVPVLSGVLFGWSSLNIFLSALMYLLGSYPPHYTASALSALGVLRYTFGAVFPLFASQMYETLGIKWTGVLLGGLSVVMMPVPWVLFRYGETLRQKSRYTGVLPTGR